MFCKKCGKEINDDAVVCVHCGCSVENKSTAASVEEDSPKTGMGVLLALLLGLIGLIIGICIYKEGTIARKTFLKGWGITFGIGVALAILGTIIMFVVLGSTAAGFVDGISKLPTA